MASGAATRPAWASESSSGWKSTTPAYGCQRATSSWTVQSVERRVEAEEAPELTWAPTSAPGKTCSRLRPRRSTYSGRGVQPMRVCALAGGCPGTLVLSTGLRTANELGFTPIDLPPLALPSPLIASRAWASSVAIGVPRPSLRTSHAARSSAVSPRSPTDRRPRAVGAIPRAREPS
jgi:hypothetical protein